MVSVKFTYRAYHHISPSEGGVDTWSYSEETLHESLCSDIGFDVVEDDWIISKGGDAHQVSFMTL